MAYKGIDKKRFAALLALGLGDDELRRFFVDNRAQLIMHGGRVQNLPHGNAARIKTLVNLPNEADTVLQRWFVKNLDMVDPIPAAETVVTLSEYEKAGGVELLEEEGQRYARSCLFHLFSSEPQEGLMEFLRQPNEGANAVDAARESSTPATVATPTTHASDPIDLVSMAKAIIALIEKRDPDEFLAPLSPTVAAVISGLHAIRDGYRDETQLSVTLPNELQSLITDFGRRQSNTHDAQGLAVGPVIGRFTQVQGSVDFDYDRDHIIGVCTRDQPETRVFIHPVGIRRTDGTVLALTQEQAQELFPASGDIIAFHGVGHPRLPARGEMGLWRVRQNTKPNPSHRTNFHIVSDKTPVFEIRQVPLNSKDYDAVRGYIKHQFEILDTRYARGLLFNFQDGLLIGCSSGKDLSKEDGFDGGLPSWRSLPAFRFEGRLVVLGPLPPSETYECESLGKSLKKLIESLGQSPDRPTRAQIKRLQELLASEELQMNASRAERLRHELAFIDQHEGALEVLMESVMADGRVKSEIERRIQEEVQTQVVKKDSLRTELVKIEAQLAIAKDKLAEHERQERKLSPAVAKAIRSSFDKAKANAVDTLGEVAVFKALFDTLEPATVSAVASGGGSSVSAKLGQRVFLKAKTSLAEGLRSLAVPAKHARAIELLVRLAEATGVLVVLEGIAARLAAVMAAQSAGDVLAIDCQVGVIDDCEISGVIADMPSAICILDANLSPLDVYARSLIDQAQRQLIEQSTTGEARRPLIVLSMVDGVAGLPIPRSVEAISFRASLDKPINFMAPEQVEALRNEIQSSADRPAWAIKLWKPAWELTRHYLGLLSPDDAALLLSLLAQLESTDTEF